MIALYIILALALLFCIYLLLIMPRREPKTSVEPLKVDYAHRGLFGGEIVENTMPAFYAASRAGYGIELDARLSSDGKVMVFHDTTLERMCGRADRVDSLTASELSWCDLKGTYEKIPMLTDVLERIDPKTPLCIELKGDSTDTTLCVEVARLLDQYDRYYSVESFNPFLLNWFRKNRPRAVRGQLVTNLLARGVKGNILMRLLCTPMLCNCISRPDYISYDIKCPKNLSVVLCDKLYHSLMFAWTVDTPEKYGEARAAGRIPIFQGFEPKKLRK